MKVWSVVTWLASCFTLSPVENDTPQQPIPGSLDLAAPPSRISGRPGHIGSPAVSEDLPVSEDVPTAPATSTALTVLENTPEIPLFPPRFKPPTGRKLWGGSEFVCEYPKLEGYLPCNAENRSCWLEKWDKSHRYDIDSNYENPGNLSTPVGKVREYTLVVEDGVWNADGLLAKDVKLINGTYPGPWIQACWGDTLRIKVINKLKHNGTAIHWHGIRQLETMDADGVPGITQCPIAPGDYFVYEFRALQYGSSWYHSHYSVQYADGLLGAITIHGPSTADWDEAKLPLLMSDWFHNSAFGVVHKKQPGYATTLLNGTGDITKYQYQRQDGSFFVVAPTAPIPVKSQLHFEKPSNGKAKRYVLRLINTSFATSFLFSIDNHKLIIIGADFVPMKADEDPKKQRKYLTIGIGQRYTVIVIADPQDLPKQNLLDGSPPNNFWIRTSVLPCFSAVNFPVLDHDRTGILRYDPDDIAEPNTQPWLDLTKLSKEQKEVFCLDEIDMKPQLEWKVPERPTNMENGQTYGEEFSVRHRSQAENPSRDYPLAEWSFERSGIKSEWAPLQIDYDNPFFLNLWQLNRTRQDQWEKKWVVIPENYTEHDWVFLAITAEASRNGVFREFAAHPIHLHGHDFAILRYEAGSFDPKKDYTLNLDNPVRRDVILLPKKGFIIIGFKTDNPGSWIMHCHIAFHASEGLALQINERQSDANEKWFNWQPFPVYHRSIREAKRVCKRWNAFQHDCTQHWPGYDAALDCWPACTQDKLENWPYVCEDKVNPLPGHVFQDDSGI